MRRTNSPALHGPSQSKCGEDRVNPVLANAQQRIFISYRRSGNGAGFALGLYEGLRSVVGPDNVFFDVSEGSIKVGQSWRDAVRR